MIITKALQRKSGMTFICMVSAPKRDIEDLLMHLYV